MKAEIQHNKTLNGVLTIPTVSLVAILGKLRTTISSKAGKTVVASLKKIAQKDLRKADSKKIKPIVKLVRNLMKKAGIDFAKKKGKNVVVKGTNPIGLILLAVDLIDLGFSMNAMLLECINELKAGMQDNKNEYQYQIKDTLNLIFDEIYENTKLELRKEIRQVNPEMENMLRKIEVSNEVIIKIKESKKTINSLTRSNNE
ncbi:MAG: hypothetical protein K9N06_04375 [Candidatus Cloacimonetes bacterium]|nr:hypothetical protein [Candidatus Cloacimonadota bacterium]